ncbi:MAG: hypothetical protein AAGD09_03435 [Cyanobacteria bacterium P01_F01_bin.56]
MDKEMARILISAVDFGITGTQFHENGGMSLIFKDAEAATRFMQALDPSLVNCLAYSSFLGYPTLQITLKE